MTSLGYGFLSIAVLIALLLARVPVGVALGAVSFVGTWLILDAQVALGMLTAVPYNFSANWTLSSIPMFLLMGYVSFHTGSTEGFFRLARVLLGRTRGGLAIATVFGAAGFSTVTGSSIACAAAMGRIAIPEMLRRNYDPGLATGVVAASGTIGSMIPPSILLIVFGIFAEVSIERLFIAGIVPGLITAAMYCIVVAMVTARNPPDEFSRQNDNGADDEMSLLQVLRGTWPMLALVIGVFGGLFSGFFTATEAGAVGAGLSLLIGLANRRLSYETFRTSVTETVVTTAALFFVALGAAMYTRFMALSGVPDFLSGWLIDGGASPLVIFIGIGVVYTLFGMFLDPIGILLLTLPVLLPVIESAGMDIIWMGILLAKLLEMSLITPPVGMNVFVIKAVVGDRVGTARIFRGVVPFLVGDFLCLALLYAAPSLTLTLPNWLL